MPFGVVYIWSHIGLFTITDVIRGVTRQTPTYLTELNGIDLKTLHGSTFAFIHKDVFIYFLFYNKSPL